MAHDTPGRLDPALRFALLNRWQHDFPIVDEPFARIGGVAEEAKNTTPGRTNLESGICSVGNYVLPQLLETCRTPGSEAASRSAAVMSS